MSAYIVPPKDGPHPPVPPQTDGGTSGPTLGAIAPWLATAVLTAVLAWVLWTGRGRVPPPDPGGIDQAFVAIGKAHAGRLGQEYADAWDDGARILDAGQPVGTALEIVGKAWESNRVAGFDKYVTPEFSKVLPESKNEKDVTPAERAALSRAWRGFAKGLRSR